MANGGLETTATYGSYRNAPDYCHFNVDKAVGRMKGFVNVTSVEALNDALATVGPLSVSIDATLPSFYFYGGGYVDDVECKSDLDSLDHSVLAVGVTTHDGQKYTLVRAYLQLKDDISIRVESLTQHLLRSFRSRTRGARTGVRTATSRSRRRTTCAAWPPLLLTPCSPTERRCSPRRR
jgi:hypothetical protein